MDGDLVALLGGELLDALLELLDGSLHASSLLSTVSC